MWQSLSIANKIRISFVILVIGYFFSVLYGFLVGGKTEDRLTIVSESMFPAATYSQTALSTYNELVKLYNDAVMLGDADILANTKEKATLTQNALESISGLSGLSQKEREDIDDTIKQFTEYTTLAQKTYSALVLQTETDSSSNSTDNIQKLAKIMEQLKEKLTGNVSDYAKSLKKELTSISNETKRLRFMNWVVFAIVVISAIIIVSIIVNRSISLPLQNTLNMVKDIAEGEGDLTKRLDIIPESCTILIDFRAKKFLHGKYLL